MASGLLATHALCLKASFIMSNPNDTRIAPDHQAIRTLSAMAWAGISARRTNGALNPAEQSVREEILTGLLADYQGDELLERGKPLTGTRESVDPEGEFVPG